VTEAVTTGDIIVESLAAHGVDTVFGIPGVQTYPLFDALARSPGIRLIGARHEQAVGYMAFGYAQATGRAGVCAVVPGPGFLNASAALISAHGKSLPVLCIAGEIPSKFLGKGLGVLHELPDQLETIRGLTKWAAMIEHPSQASELIAQALYQASSGRPRPAALTVPMDVLAATISRPPVTAPIRINAPAADPAAIEAAAELLNTAGHPMIMAGGGAMNAGPEVAGLARVLQAPVVSFRGGRGVLDDDDPYCLTAAAGYHLWPRTDALVAIGTRLELLWYRWPPRPDPPRLVLIDIDPRQAARLQPEVSIVADARAAVQALAGRIQKRNERSAEFEETKRSTAEQIRDIGPDLDYLAAIRAALPADGFFVEEICQAGFASYLAFPVHGPRQFISCGHQGTLGFGFPTALGVKAAFPERPVVSVSGDGGFTFGIAELATAVQYDLGVVAVVFNNEAFGNVLLDQRRLYGREVGSRLRNPDFAAVAAAFGAAGYTVRTPEELERTIVRALAAGRPAVIEVKTSIGGAVSPWRYLMPGSR
jgi:acetolactate synthase I/II/III large subunit